MRVSIYIFTAFFISTLSAYAKNPPRNVASERPACYANIGPIGDSARSITKEFDALYLAGCLTHSASENEMKVPSSGMMGGTRKDFEATLKINSVPFIFTQGDYEYHLFQGKIVGVTKQR